MPPSLQVAFLELEGGHPLAWALVNAAIDLVYLFDLLVNWRTAYVQVGARWPTNTDDDRCRPPPSLGAAANVQASRCPMPDAHGR